MPYNAEFLQEKLQKELEATHVELEDMSDGCGAKFKCLIVSKKFEGKGLLDRHRMVNSVLAEELKDIHAFTQKTLTPEQWEKEKS